MNLTINQNLNGQLGYSDFFSMDFIFQFSKRKVKSKYWRVINSIQKFIIVSFTNRVHKYRHAKSLFQVLKSIFML